MQSYKLLLNLLAADGHAQTLLNGQSWALKGILKLHIRGLEDLALVHQREHLLFEDTNLSGLLLGLFGANTLARAVGSRVQVTQLGRLLRKMLASFEFAGRPALLASIKAGSQLLGLGVDQIRHLVTRPLPKLDAARADVIFEL